MYICTIYARHPAEVLQISLFNASTSLHLVYENKQVPSSGPLYGTEFGYLKWSE